MNPMKRMIALCAIAIALAACSRDLSAQSTRAAAAPTSAAADGPASAPASAPEPVLRALPDFSQLVDRYGPAVVNVEVVEKPQPPAGGLQGLSPNDPFYDFFHRFGVPGPGQGPRANQPPSRGAGSGFIINSDGYILTNTHVVANADEVTVRLTDRREFPAKVIGADERTDVAVIKISATNLPIVKLGDPSRIKPGQWVLAIGSPFGFENSATAGIVSAKGRTLESGYVPFIQTDVPINPGNSGGPLFNMRGEVVGINSQIYSRSGGYMGVSFSIPIDVALQVGQQLQATGHVTRGKLGVVIQSVTQGLADSFGLPQPQGALVSSVEKGGPAERAGIESGDVILKLNGQPLKDSSELPVQIAAVAPGTSVNLEIWRNHATREVAVKLGTMEEQRTAASAGPHQEGGKLGLAVRPLTADEQRGANMKGGLVVERASGPAAEAGIQPGDVVLAANGSPLNNAEELRSAVEKSKGHIALLIQRGETRLFVPVRVG